MARQRSGDRAQGRGDAGQSLVEVMVTMGILGVVMVIFTGAILQVYRTSTATESLSTAQSQLRIAFQRFDRELRYASWIAEPGYVDTAWYVEFAGPSGTGCRQLRLETDPGGVTDDLGILQLVEWTPGSPPAAGEPGQTIASQIVTTGVAPFFDTQYANEMPYATPSTSTSAVGTDFTSDFQRLRIRLTTKVAAGTAQIDVTFTALNTSRSSPATNACSEGRPT